MTQHTSNGSSPAPKSGDRPSIQTWVTIGAVALGTFSFGLYMGERRDRTPAHTASARDSVAATRDNIAPSSDAPSVSVTTGDPAGSGAGLWTCSMHPQVIQAVPGVCPICHMELTPLKAGPSGAGDNIVRVDPAVVQNMGVRTAAVAKGPLIQSVRVVGYLEEPEYLHHDINLRVSGWIEKLYANIDGMAISKGDTLFDLYSPELTIAIDELISARKQTDIAPNDETSRPLFDSARRKLQQYGLAADQVDALARLDAAPRTVPILAPMSGHMTAKMVYEGSAVKAGDLVLRLASRHHMWIDAQVYEQQMPLISDGQPVRATLVSQPGKSFEGKVLFVHPHLDPQTRTATVRIEIPNEDHSLRQGMYATCEILADAYHEALVVPREAVIDTGRKQLAFVALGDGKFEPRMLKLGQAGQDGTVQVLSGLKEGEQVVTSGQFLLDSESRLREAIAKFGASDSPKPVAASSMPAPPPMADLHEQVPHTDDVVCAYLDLSKALGARQTSSIPLDVTRLLESARMATEHASPDARPLARAVADAADSLVGKRLDEQRIGFLALSEAVIKLTRSSKPTGRVSSKLYILHCPMAFSEKGADWMQDSDAVANPYYPVEMKKCGSVTETLDLSR
jgi:RND family efflux transporter MFP subunit